eukprot:1193746-Prorocentrum_minimum.AAC.4
MEMVYGYIIHRLSLWADPLRQTGSVTLKFMTFHTLAGFLDVARPRQAIGQAERREASPRGSVGGGRASSRNWQEYDPR